MITKEELIRWQTDEEFQLEKVKQDGYNIRYIRIQSEKNCLESVKQNGNSIQYINNPSEKICLEVMKKNGRCIKYINNPSERVCLEALHNCKMIDLDKIIKYIDIEKYPDVYEKYCFMIM